MHFMSKSKRLLTVELGRLSLACFLVAVPLAAQADGLTAAVGYAQRDDIKGAEVQVGYRKQFSYLGLNLVPLSGIWNTPKESRFREETLANGQSACRDTSNGQFADKENCNKSFSYAFMASADLSPVDWLSLGAGVRIGQKVDPFGSVRLRLGSKLSMQAQGGGKYLAASLAIGL